MNITHKLPDDFSRNYLQARKKISVVIQYLESLKSVTPTEPCTDESVRMLLEVLKDATLMYNDLNDIPVYNAELRAENHILKVENKRLIELNDALKKLKL